MRRAVRISLKDITETKRKQINNLIVEYRRIVNVYVESLWNNPGKLDEETLNRVYKQSTRLSNRYCANALKQALSIVCSTKKALRATHKNTKKIPIFEGFPILDSKFITITLDPSPMFDLYIKLSTLRKQRRIFLPCKRTAVFNKWFGKGKLIQGCELHDIYLILWIEVPDLTIKTEGDAVGIDLGVNKLLAVSNGTLLGTEISTPMKKCNRRMKGSKGKQRAFDERKNYINQQLNLLPWNSLVHVAVEELKGIKKGKKKGRGKDFRKAMAPWTHRQVTTRIQHKCEENGVFFITVDPRNTSRTCPICGTVSEMNRRGEKFRCVSCRHSGDADLIAASNVFRRSGYMGSVVSPILERAI